MKKFMNYLGEGVDAEGSFLHQIRRSQTREEFFRICMEYFDHDRSMKLDPFPSKTVTPVASS
jgi:tRNA-dihydrouridine synthase B